MQPLDGVAETELDLARVSRASHRRGTGRVWGTGERDMAFAGQQPGRGIQTNPTRTRHINLRPGVQIGEVLFRAGRAVQGFNVGGQLHQITGHEARRQPHMPQRLYQQPGGIAARAAAQY